MVVHISPAIAVDLNAPNNAYGMHLAGVSDQDIHDVASLVNSQGGDWGYVTIVIPAHDRNTVKWQEVFDKLRTAHLIPLVRIAAAPDGGVWKRPQKEDVQGWVQFLNSLNWVVKDRYVILFNEPNHATEWGGQVDATSYADISTEFAKRLKESNPDYFVMLAGMDAAAPEQAPNYKDEAVFLREVIAAQPSIFDNIDGLSSHSYPNPGFSGSPYSRGRNSVFNFQWELELLKNLGVTKELPVFITETGWIHAEGNAPINSLSAQQVAENYKVYFEAVIQDSRVRAVTPFVLDYQADPFTHFSWKKVASSEFYPQYKTVQEMTKQAGKPNQIIKVRTTVELPKDLLEGSNYKVRLYLRNTGQAILDSKDGYALVGESNNPKIRYSFSALKGIKPNGLGIVDLSVKTKDASGSAEIKIGLSKDNEKKLDMLTWNFQIKPKPDLHFKTAAFPKISSSGNDYEIQIFDKDEELVYQQSKVAVNNNKGAVLGASNVAFEEKYRVVLLKPYYLPRQMILTFKEGENATSFMPMLPIDYNLDGKFSIEDIQTLFQKPWLLGLWLPR